MLGFAVFAESFFFLWFLFFVCFDWRRNGGQCPSLLVLKWFMFWMNLLYFVRVCIVEDFGVVLCSEWCRQGKWYAYSCEYKLHKRQTIVLVFVCWTVGVVLHLHVICVCFVTLEMEIQQNIFGDSIKKPRRRLLISKVQIAEIIQVTKAPYTHTLFYWIWMRKHTHINVEHFTH